MSLEANRQRIDRWIWHARLVKTRASAATLAASGRVRLNGQRVTAPGRAVRIGDVLTINLPGSTKVLRVVAFAPRRSGSESARTLYDDLSPPAGLPPPFLPEQAGRVGSRPTKRERRALERLRRRDGWTELGPEGQED